jgi:enamidase
MAQPDVVSHINGGPTSIAHDHIRDLCLNATGALEVVHNGNELSALVALQAVQSADRLADLLIGTDAPAGSGVQPNGMLRMLALLSGVGGLPPEQAICLATGNIARRRNLAQGVIAVGRPADLVFLDRPEASSGRDVREALGLGDIPGIGAVMIDGKLRCGRSRSTPPAARVPV